MRMRDVQEWAEMMMEENKFEREAAIKNIPSRMNKEDRDDISEELKTACFGPVGGPLCKCSFGEEYRANG